MEADVARFLRCIYTAADSAALGGDAALPAVVRLAHALDTAPVLVAARRHLLGSSVEAETMASLNEVDQIAALCGWDDFCVRNTSVLVFALQSPLSDATTRTPAQRPDARGAGGGGGGGQRVNGNEFAHHCDAAPVKVGARWRRRRSSRAARAGAAPHRYRRIRSCALDRRPASEEPPLSSSAL